MAAKKVEKTDEEKEAKPEKFSIKTGSKELDAVCRALAKKFGKAEQFSMGPRYEKARPIPTDSLMFDAATNIGGIPRGRVIEIFGEESSGKTSLCFWILKKDLETYPEDERPGVIIDMERSIDPSIPQTMGLDPTKILFMYPDTAEEALQMAVDVVACGGARLMFLDSVDAMQTESRLTKDLSENDMVGIAKLMGTALRQISKSAPDNETTAIFINQIRDTMDKYKPIATSGGHALKFYASMRIQLMATKESDVVPHAFLMRPKLIKSKMGPPHKQGIEIHFQYAMGPDYKIELVSYCKEVGVLRFAGKAVFFNEGGTPIRVSTTSSAGLWAACEEDPTLLSRIREAALLKSYSGDASHIVEADVEEEEVFTPDESAGVIVPSV